VVWRKVNRRLLPGPAAQEAGRGLHLTEPGKLRNCEILGRLNGRGLARD
jgi:hypothetical protein